jgi:hypothetical protein
MVWSESVGGMRHDKREYKMMVGKRLLTRHRSRWEDTIKINMKEIGCEGVEWIHLAQDKDQWRFL